MIIILLYFWIVFLLILKQSVIVIFKLKLLYRKNTKLSTKLVSKISLYNFENRLKSKAGIRELGVINNLKHDYIAKGGRY